MSPCLLFIDVIGSIRLKLLIGPSEDLASNICEWKGMREAPSHSHFYGLEFSVVVNSYPICINMKQI